jgi:hypothetical protein
MRNDLSPFTPACLEDRTNISGLLEHLAPLFARLPMLQGILASHAYVDDQYEMLAQVSFVCASIIPEEPPQLRSWDSLDLDIFDGRTLFEMTQTIGGNVALDRGLRDLWRQGGQTGPVQPITTLITPHAVVFEMHDAYEMLRDLAEDGKVDPDSLTHGQRLLTLSVMARRATSNHDALNLHRKAVEALRMWSAVHKHDLALWADTLGLRLDDPSPAEMLTAIKESTQ